MVSDAKVTVTDMTANKTFTFTFADGVYSHDPGAGQKIAEVGHVYKLRLELKEGIFEATDTVKRVPLVDSIAADFKTKEESISGKEGFYARFYGKDLAGAPDWYWIRSYRNTLQNRIEDIFAIDGSFAEDVADGLSFIQPISEGITDYDKPYQEGEKVIVRLASVTKPSYTFLDQVQQQVDNGGLFAKILENVPTNVLNTDKNASGRVLGGSGRLRYHSGKKPCRNKIVNQQITP